MESSRFPKLTAMRAAPPATRALVSKLNHDPQNGGGSSGRAKSINLNRFMLERISNKTAQDIADSDTSMQLLPDLELVEQILVGSILSPKDMSTADIQFKLAENQFEGPIGGLMLEVPNRHFKHDYKIDERLDIQLENILTKTGATILLTLPENNIDAIINSQLRPSTESYQTAIRRLQSDKPLGILGHPSRANVSLENFNGALDDVSKVRNLKGQPMEYVTVTDNFNVLKQSGYRSRLRTAKIEDRINRLNASMEDASANMSLDLSTQQIDELYRNRPSGSKAIEVITPQAFMENPSVGHPLTIDLPPEAVIPVFTPGKPDEHLGYFLLLDIHHRFVTKATARDYYDEMRTSFNGKVGSKDNSSELLRMTREAMGIGEQTTTFELEQIQQTYATILETDLQNRLRNGMYDEDLELGFNEEIVKLMMVRQFKRMNTQMLYVPAELISYIAFNYTKDGVGQTLLARSKILSNMRSILLFAETMGGVRNAVGRKKVSITLDPNDPDKTDTVAKIQEMIMEVARTGFPIGAPDPAQSLDYLNRAAYDFAINADSDDYGQTKVDYDDYNTSVQAGNPELQDRLRRMQVSGLGVPPEKVDPTASPDFAVGVVQNDLIMTRRVKRYQRIFCQGQTKFVRTYTRNSSILIQRLLKVIADNEGVLTPEQKALAPDILVRQFINALEAKLPEPDTTRIDLMAQAFNQYNDLLDNALAAYVTPDLFPDDSFGGASGAADRFKNVIKAYFQRQYLAANNVLPELSVLHEMEGEKPAFSMAETQKGYLDTMGTAMQEFLAAEKLLKEKWAKQFPEVAAGGGDDAGGFGGGDAGGFGDTGGGFDDGGFGGDDTGGGMDMGGLDDTGAPGEGGEDGGMNLDGLDDGAGAEGGETPAADNADGGMNLDGLDDEPPAT